ncbi:MAG: hypothetical protein FJ090_01850 [Deltaproteobacteria bacterium]|nr:hypothetical protein [Deltaproteobacteria bacterium]
MLPILLLACDPGSAPPGDSSAPADTGVPDPSGDPQTVALLGECPLETHYGGFVVEAYESYAIVDGTVSNGVVPVTVLENVATEGDCTLLKRNNPYCDPTCDSKETCDFDGTCIEYPVAQDLGTVTIAGIDPAAVMAATSPGYRYFKTDMDFPPWTAGELIQLSTTGATVESFTLHGVGPDMLEPTSTTWSVASGEDLVVGWDAPAGEVRSSVRLSLNIDQHGQTPVTLVCHFDDDGEASVPSSVIDAVMGAGVTGYPSASLRRQTADSTTLGGGTTTGGCVDLLVAHELAIRVEVEGHTPCTTNADCPPGHPCDLATQTCL